MSMHIIDLEGNQIDAIKHSESFAALTKVKDSKYIVAADVKANVLLCEFDKTQRQIKYFQWWNLLTYF